MQPFDAKYRTVLNFRCAFTLRSIPNNGIFRQRGLPLPPQSSQVMTRRQAPICVLPPPTLSNEIVCIGRALLLLCPNKQPGVQSRVSPPAAAGQSRLGEGGRCLDRDASRRGQTTPVDEGKWDLSAPSRKTRRKAKEQVAEVYLWSDNTLFVKEAAQYEYLRFYCRYSSRQGAIRTCIICI